MLPDSKALRIGKRSWFRLRHKQGPAHTVTAKCRGVIFEVASDNLLAEPIYANAFEREERTVISQIVREDSIAIDIGANIGFYTCLFARAVGRHGKVFSFEPTPGAYEGLLRNVRLNRFEDVVHTYNLALSSSKGTVVLNNFSDGNEAYNSIGATHSFGRESSGVLSVETDTLDGVLNACLESADLSKLDCFVKIDVEGSENAVLRGGESFLNASSRVSLMIELCEPLSQQCGADVNDTLTLMRSLGFRGFWVDREFRLAPFTERERPILTKRSLNVFFLKPDSEQSLRNRGIITANTRSEGNQLAQ